MTGSAHGTSKARFRLMTRVQEIRHECLLQLYGSKEIPIAAELIVKVAWREGFDYSAREVRDALFYLRGRGFCELVPVAATGEELHRITSAGMNEWEQHHG